MSYYLPEHYELGEYDVFCGRGSKCLNHIGNHRFRILIDSNMDRYINARNRFEKNVIIKEIVNHVKNRNGEFVKQDLETWKYYAISDTMARDKASQAFRDAISNRKSSINNQESIHKKEMHRFDFR